MKMSSVPSPPLLRVLPGCLCQLSKGGGGIFLRVLIHIALPAKLSNEPLLDSATQRNPLALVEPCKYSWEHCLAWDGTLSWPLPSHCPSLAQCCHWAVPALPVTVECAEAAEAHVECNSVLRRDKTERWSFSYRAGVESKPGNQGGCSTGRGDWQKLGFFILFKKEPQALDSHLGEALCSWLCVWLYRCHMSLATAFAGKLVSVLLLFAINSPAK